ncbi:hypothetical protein OAC72_03925 [Flavobacteriales bacterium]|nr:hypothetical protein [Flavobacteriales bacterium]
MRLIIFTTLFLIPLIGLASFPIAENGVSDISNTINFQMVEHEQFSFEFFEPFLAPIFFFIMMYFLWKWKKKNRNLPIVKWSELHWAWKALLILIILSGVLGVLAIIFLIREFS